MDLDHLLLLCCYGGQPYVDFHPALRSVRQLDPTEWVAEDIAGSLLENSTLSIPGREAVRAAGVLLSACDLYNVTFLTTNDQAVFRTLHADLACRCPSTRSGASCELRPPIADQLVQEAVSGMPAMVIVFAAVLLALIVIVFLMVRGCFCDCFGPFALSAKRFGEEPYDKPLDPQDVEKCLRRYREYEARTNMQNEPGVPLLPTVSGSAQLSGSAPYDSLPSAPPRPSSPPPAYSSVAGSQERISS